MPKTQNMRDLLTKLAHDRAFELKMFEQKIFALWQKILGKPLDTNTSPVSLSDGVLKVYTEYPAYKTELALHIPRIIKDLNAELGQPILTDIRIEVRPGSEATPPPTEHVHTNAKTSEETTPNVHTLTRKESEKIEQTIADVPNTDLRTALRQLFITQKQEKS